MSIFEFGGLDTCPDCASEHGPVQIIPGLTLPATLHNDTCPRMAAIPEDKS